MLDGFRLGVQIVGAPEAGDGQETLDEVGSFVAGPVDHARQRLGEDVPPWDFRVDGVTSVSADIHKYGYAAKGASTITYRNLDYLRYQMFAYENWPGGVFASSALLGTRPGGAYAAAWAVTRYFGRRPA